VESFLQRKMIPPIPTHFSVAWSVGLSVTFVLPLKLFDGFRCHVAGKLVGSNDTLC